MDTTSSKLIKFPCGCTWNARVENDRIVGIDYDPLKAPLTCKKTWQMLSDGLTLGTFQLESNLGQSLSAQCKPRDIRELSDLIAIMRPGCMDAITDGKSMTKRYIDRKFNREKVKPLVDELSETTKDTYGILIYQEQVMKAAQQLAGFDGYEARELQKAMGKKKPEVMAAVKVKFVAGCQKHSGFSKELAEMIFDVIEANQRYSFNLCLAKDTILELESGDKITIAECKIGQRIKDHTGGYTTIINKYYNGPAKTITVGSQGYKIQCTIGHRFWCEDGYKRTIPEIILKDRNLPCIIIDGNKKIAIEYINTTDNVTSTFDIEVDNKDHVYLANGIAVSNSHSCQYSLNNYLFSAYPKAHFPKAFFCAQLEFCDKQDKIRQFISEAKAFGIEVLKPDLRSRNNRFLIKGNNILYSLSHIKHVGNSSISNVLSAIVNIDLPSISFLELYCLYLYPHLDSRAVDSLIKSGALDFFGLDRLYLLHQVSIFSKLNEKQQNYCIVNLREKPRLIDTLKEMAAMGTGKYTLCSNKTSLKKLQDIIKFAENPGASLEDNQHIRCKFEKEVTGFEFSMELPRTYPGINSNCDALHRNMRTSEYIKKAKEHILPVRITSVRKLKNSFLIDIVDETGFLNGLFIKTDFALVAQKNNNVIIVADVYSGKVKIKEMVQI